MATVAITHRLSMLIHELFGRWGHAATYVCVPVIPGAYNCTMLYSYRQEMVAVHATTLRAALMSYQERGMRGYRSECT